MNQFSNFLKRDNPGKKLQNEIESIRFRKQSLVTPLQNDAIAAQKQIDDTLYRIGCQIYERCQSGELKDETLTAFFAEIATQKKLIEEREAKIAEFSARYDEEIDILQANLSSQQSVQQPAPFRAASNANADAAQSGAFCPKCGKPYAPGEDLFCMSCGQSLT